MERSLDSVKSQVVEKSAPEPLLACPPRTFFWTVNFEFWVNAQLRHSIRSLFMK